MHKELGLVVELRYFGSTPVEGEKIWRYMDFTNFVSLLDKQALFFAMVCKFNDPQEGFYPEANVQLKFDSTSFQDPLSCEDFIEKERRWSLEESKQFREWVAINCWHINDFESAAMWKLYLKSNQGIAIQSTYAGLKKGFRSATNRSADIVYIDVVNYINYDNEPITGPKWSIFETFLHKRKSYEHERELRAMILRPHNTKDNFPNSKTLKPYGGTYVSVCLEELIEKIYISPTAPEWLENLVTSVMNKYDLEKEVTKSSLTDRGSPY